MAKTLVDVPKDKLIQAAAALGTSSKRETVERALDVVIQQDAQRRLIAAVTSGEVSPNFTVKELANIRP